MTLVVLHVAYKMLFFNVSWVEPHAKNYRTCSVECNAELPVATISIYAIEINSKAVPVTGCGGP
jgi:hypothetical protein